MWDVFKGSTEKLASCHMELVRKLQELIKEVQKYVEEQSKAHKKVRTFGVGETVNTKYWYNAIWWSLSSDFLFACF